MSDTDINPAILRGPYQQTYKDFHTGELITIRRSPPTTLHSMLPTDIVELSTRKNSDWEQGEVATIEHINYKQPNVLQLTKGDQSTFMLYNEVNLKEAVAERNDVPRLDRAVANKYLLWP